MFNETIRALRDSKGLTGEAVAKAVGLSESAYRNYERGVREPSFETLSNLADFYGVTTDYLLGREPPTDPFEMLGLDTSSKNVVEEFAGLPDDSRKFILDIVIKLAHAAETAGQEAPDRVEYTLGELEDMQKAKEAESKDGGKFA